VRKAASRDGEGREVESGERDGGRRWPMSRLGLGKIGAKRNGEGEEWKKGGKWEELN